MNLCHIMSDDDTLSSSFIFSHNCITLVGLELTFAGSQKPCFFNTGLMVIDLERWRDAGKIEEWMELQKRIWIHELGSLSPFLLVFSGNIAPVDHRWNQHGLGGDNFRVWNFFRCLGERWRSCYFRVIVEETELWFNCSAVMYSMYSQGHITFVVFL
ncbi:hypothetical protein K1719_003943 [Acacia pycnantha]|nr:hypothetical protein K1719_003943 [Acacia pycnantha]